MKTLIFFSVIGLTVFGCKVQQKSNIERTNNASTMAAPQPFGAAPARIVVYKTGKDYRTNVPVTLSDDKTTIVSYPHPTDLVLGENLTLPTPLHNGYLLDNRGIHKNVAFLKYTYSQYAKLKDVPTLQEIQQSIIDKDPLTELWDCGPTANFTNLQDQLNEWIDRNLLAEKCKRMR
jgi:hypothetical protein